jgi:hypothetical protein
MVLAASQVLLDADPELALLQVLHTSTHLLAAQAGFPSKKLQPL